VGELVQRYQRQPLPEQWEFVDQVPSLGADQHAAPILLPGHPDYRVTLWSADAASIRVHAALMRGVDYDLVAAPPDLAGRFRPIVCVTHTNASWDQVREDYFKRFGIEVVDTNITRLVLVARCDGRQLPEPFNVIPVDASELGAKQVTRAGGTSTTVRSVLEAFERALNHDVPPNEANRIVILDETGLPIKPGPNQSALEVCLTYEYAFWSGPGTTELQFAWFRDNFGITFHEEERELKTVAFR